MRTNVIACACAAIFACTMVAATAAPPAATQTEEPPPPTPGEQPPHAPPDGQPPAPPVGYERISTATIALDHVTPVKLKQERDRCYAVVLRLQPGAAFAAGTRSVDITVGNFDDSTEQEQAAIGSQGGTSNRWCPLATGATTLTVFHMYPRRRNIGTGSLVVEVWSRKMPAKWLRDEAAGRRDLASQPPPKVRPGCSACERSYSRCEQRGGEHTACFRTYDDCMRDAHCLDL